MPGCANPVMALENGTMGWELAGFDLARGREDALPPPSPAGLARARALADQVAQRFGVRRIDDAALARFEGEAEERTLYVFDVRSPEEYAQGHLAAARSAPGGQLVQATDVYMATRNARIVLVDDDGVRAAMTGSWLAQMGWPEVYVLDGGMTGRKLVQGTAAPVIPELERGDGCDDRAGRAEDAARQRRGGSHRSGAEHRLRGRAHPRRLVRGARAARPEPRPGAAAAGSGADLARWAARPARRRRAGDQRRRRDPRARGRHRLPGAPPGCRSPPAARRWPTRPNDCWRRPYDPYAGAGARERYLRWEIELVHQIEREGDVGFRIPG